MGGSLNHILGVDGEFTMVCIDNLGDAYEALKECFDLIVILSEGDCSHVSAACRRLGIVDPYRKEDRLDDEPMPEPMAVPERVRVRSQTAWPPHEILRRLVDLAEYTLIDQSCDRHGHEVDRAAVDAAKELLRDMGHPIY